MVAWPGWWAKVEADISAQRTFHVVEQAIDDGVDGHAVGLGAVAEQDAVAERGMDEGADVLGVRGTACEQGSALAPRTIDCAARRPAPSSPTP